MTRIETASGQIVDLAHPDPATIRLGDIAHGLSMTCRFAGHTSRFYSVAEHAVLVARRVQSLGHSERTVLAALHHDDAEAFLGDIPAPLKCLVPDFAPLEEQMLRVIGCALGLLEVSRVDHDVVKKADVWALRHEAYQLMRSQGAETAPGPIPDDAQHNADLGLPPAAAAAAWLGAHQALMAGRPILTGHEPVQAPEQPVHPSSIRFHDVLTELATLHDLKSRDYGRDDDPFANVRASADWGMPAWVGAMVRATDKVRRLQSYARTGRLANEGAADAFLDLAVYAVIGFVLHEQGD